MGCSPSSPLLPKGGQEPLSCTRVFTGSSNNPKYHTVTSPDAQHNNNNNNHNNNHHNNNGDLKLHKKNNNSVEKVPTTQTYGKERDLNISGDSDSSSIIAMIASEERTQKRNLSPLHMQMLKRRYRDSNFTPRDSLNHSSKSGTKDPSINGILHHRNNHMLSTRPMKSVKFLDSVTVITVC